MIINTLKTFVKNPTKSYTRLIYRGRDLHDDDAIVLSRLLQINNSVIELDLTSNKIGPEGAVALGQSLESNNTIQELILDGNKLGPKGTVAIGRALESNLNIPLTKLTLTGCNISLEGAIVLFARRQ